MLPKVPKAFDKLTPCRPIVASIGSLTEPLSKFVSAQVAPLVGRLRSYLRDTSDFIDQISQIRLDNENILLVTMDVTSLCTNISNEIRLTALRFFSDSRNDNFLSTDFLNKNGQASVNQKLFSF